MDRPPTTFCDRPADSLRGETSSAAAATTSRVAELDSLRGFAAIAVMIFHTKPGWLPFGWAAVDLFFVLSGYLITSIILRHGGAPRFLVNFYTRRGLRTWPIYYLAIGVMIVLSPVLHRSCNWSQLPTALLYCQGLTRLWGGSTSPFSPYLLNTWSLAIEEQFYLIWPALILAVGHRRVAVLAILCAGGSILARSQGIWWDSLTRSDGLALGSLLAALRFHACKPDLPAWRHRFAFRAIRLAGLAALAILCILGHSSGLKPESLLSGHPMLALLAVNLVWLGVLDLVVANAGRRSLRFLRLRAVQSLGTISYGLYLYHYPIHLLLLDLARRFGVSRVMPLRLVAILLTFALAAASWRHIERPLLALKRRWSYLPTQSTAIPADRRRRLESAAA